MTLEWATAVGMKGRHVACRLQETVRVLEVFMRGWSSGQVPRTGWVMSGDSNGGYFPPKVILCGTLSPKPAKEGPVLVSDAKCPQS